MARYFVGGGDSGALARFTRLHGVADLAQVDDGGEAAIAVEIPLSGSATEHLFSLTEAGQFAAGDILVRYRMSSALGAAQWDRGNGAFFRGRSDEMTLYSSGLRRVALAAIYSQVAGSLSLLASTNPGSGDNNIYKWCRSNFNGTALKLKVWAGTIGDEPAGWTHSITNSTITAAGWAGIFAAATGASAVTHYWTNIGVSTDPSEPAPHEPVGGVETAAQLTAQEPSSDSASLSAAVEVVGALSGSESGSDTASASSAIYVSGALTTQEQGQDEYSGQISVVEGRSAQLSAQESGSDSAEGAAVVSIAGSVGATEAGKDAAALSAVASIRGSLSAAEAGQDDYSGSVVLGDSLSVTLTAQESGSDSADGAALVVIQGGLLSRESGSDSSAGAALVLLQGGLSAREMGSDVYSGRSSDADPYRVTAITGSVPESRIIGAIPSNRIVGAA